MFFRCLGYFSLCSNCIEYFHLWQCVWTVKVLVPVVVGLGPPYCLQFGRIYHGLDLSMLTCL